MQSSLPARPSLEQLKKQAKDLVRAHQEKQPEALALIARHLPALAGKSAEEVIAYPFALHDAQSIVARQYGFPAWNQLSEYVESLAKMTPGEPVAPLDVEAKLRTVFASNQTEDYALYCSVMSGQMKAFITQERFNGVCMRMAPYFKSGAQTAYLGCLQRTGCPVYFWKMYVPGWDSDLLIRMALNNEGLISGLLYSDPFDTGINKK